MLFQPLLALYSQAIAFRYPTMEGAAPPPLSPPISSLSQAGLVTSALRGPSRSIPCCVSFSDRYILYEKLPFVDLLIL